MDFAQHPRSHPEQRAGLVVVGPYVGLKRVEEPGGNENARDGLSSRPRKSSAPDAVSHVAMAGLTPQVMSLQSKPTQLDPSHQRHLSASRETTLLTLAEPFPELVPDKSKGDVSPQRYSFDSDLRNYYRKRSHSSSEWDQELPIRPGLEPHRQDSGKTLVETLPGKIKQSTLIRLFSGSRKQKVSISRAFNARHIHHVTYDGDTGRFLNLPKEWEDILRETSEDRWGTLLANPSPHSPTLYRTASFDDVRELQNPYRMTMTSVADSLLTEESRYQRPVERPESFTSTVESLPLGDTEETSGDGEVLSGPSLPRTSGNSEITSTPPARTPRPLPHMPLP